MLYEVITFLWHLTVSGVSRKGGQPVIQARRGGKCDAVTLDPGPYVIDISHDVRGVLTGKTAVIRLPDNTRLIVSLRIMYAIRSYYGMPRSPPI